MTRTAASLAVSNNYGKGVFLAREIRKWETYWLRDGKIPIGSKGKYHRLSGWLNDENLVQFVRQCIFLKKRYVSQSLELELHAFEEALEDKETPGYHRISISSRQVRRWLNKLGYNWKDIRKGVYIDGHEREDVVRYREIFVAEMSKIEDSGRLLRLDSEGNTVYPSNLPPGIKPLVLLTHDESTFNANDGIRHAWLKNGHQILRPKARGKGIMVSDVITQVGRLVVPDTVSDVEMNAAGVFRRDAAEFLEYGKDNWWDAEKMCQHILEIVEPMARLIYPDCELVFLFDNATNHSCFASDALNARAMRLGTGGIQPIMREGFDYNRMLPHAMVDGNGKAKGLRTVLKERSLWREGLRMSCADNNCDSCKLKKRQRAINLEQHPQTGCSIPRKCKDCFLIQQHTNTKDANGCCAVRILSLQRDFAQQKGKLQEMLEVKGHLVKFYPKFHCELNWIEYNSKKYYWGVAKRYARHNCEYSLEALRENIPEAIQSVGSVLIYKFFLRTTRMWRAYKNNHLYGSQEYQLIVYKSHRRVRVREDDDSGGEDMNCGGVDEENGDSERFTSGLG
ncbi:hypothetical protein BJ508DRAFT_210526 [Ascobolus immersus RN42]|uniref:Uncharacterized protein n=1 Tax=Ascobolus immersus RN42 TaxID=1160509 RepID=A0A3N4I3Y4_ASCIM|nr:hypothetical protein BJ508DRAFT_210526 [Ascobolus immersus RN42]